MLPIQQRLTPYNYTAMTNRDIKYIVVHYVGAVSTAKNNVDYYANNKLQASAHYFVDEISIWQSVEDENRAWHCGGGLQGSSGHTYYKICTNSNSIGIEMCVKKDKNGKWYFEPETVKNTIDLINYLMDKHNLSIENVIRHYDVTGKNCPAPCVDEDNWQKFKNKLVEEENMSQMIYNYVDENMPEWARNSVQKLIDKGYLQGDNNGELGLTHDMLRILVILDRTGVFDK